MMSSCYFCVNAPFTGCTCRMFALCAKHDRNFSKMLRSKTSSTKRGSIDIFSFIKWFKYDFTDSVKYWEKSYSNQLELITMFFLTSGSFPFGSLLNKIIIIAISHNFKIVGVLNDENEIVICRICQGSKLKEFNKFKISFNMPNYKSSLIISDKYDFAAYTKDKFIEFFYYNENKDNLKQIEIGYTHSQIKLSKDDKLIFFADYKKIKIYYAENLLPAKEFTLETPECFIDISDDNKIYFCSKYHESILKVFDIKNENVSKEIRIEKSQTTCFILSATNSFLSTAHKNKAIVVYLLPELVESFILKSHESEIESLAFNSDDSKLLSSGLDFYLFIWDLFSRSASRKIDLKVGYFYITMMEGNNLLILGHDNDIKRMNIENECVESLIESHHDHISSIAISKSLKYLATGGHDHRVFIYNTQDSKYVFRIDAHEGCVNSLCFSKNEEFLVTQGGDCLIKIWNRSTFELFRYLESDKYINQLFLDDTLLFANNEYDKLKIWNLENGKFHQLESPSNLEHIYLITKNKKFMILIKKELFIIWKLILV